MHIMYLMKDDRGMDRLLRCHARIHKRPTEEILRATAEFSTVVVGKEEIV